MYVTEIDEDLIMLDCIYKNVRTLKYHIVNIYILYISGVGLWTMTWFFITSYAHRKYYFIFKFSDRHSRVRKQLHLFITVNYFIQNVFKSIHYKCIGICITRSYSMKKYFASTNCKISYYLVTKIYLNKFLLHEKMDL